jgi:hypothetical protein
MGTFAVSDLSLTRSPPWRSIAGERAIQPKASPAYASRKAALENEAVLLSLDLVEEGIAVDPVHRSRRPEIDGIVFDRTEPGLMVAWTMDGDEPLLLSFADLWDR